VESGVESKLDEASGCLLLVVASAQVPFSALLLPVSDRKSIWPVENLLHLSPKLLCSRTHGLRKSGGIRLTQIHLENGCDGSGICARTTCSESLQDGQM